MDTASPERSEWRENGPLLLCSLIGLPASMVSLYALGQFLGPLEESFGWSRTQASVGLSIALVISFLLMPVVGRLVDRFNARWLILSGFVLTGIALAAFSLATQSLGLWIALWCFHALGATLIGPAVWLAVVAAAFDKYRSMAIAVVLCGSGIASAFGPTSARYLIDAFGWRQAFVMLSAVWIVPAFLLACLFFFDRRLRGDDAAKAETHASVPPANIRQTYFSANFIKLALAVVASQTALSAYMIHLAPALADKGFSLTYAASIAGLAGIAAIPGKIMIGYVFDRMGKTSVSFGIMALVALACTLLALDSQSLAAALSATALLGISAGAMMAFIACLSRDLFPASIFGTVYGAMTSLSALGAAMGPLAASAVHDQTGSYALAFWLGVGIAAVSAILLASLSPKAALPASA